MPFSAPNVTHTILRAVPTDPPPVEPLPSLPPSFARTTASPPPLLTTLPELRSAIDSIYRNCQLALENGSPDPVAEIFQGRVLEAIQNWAELETDQRAASQMLNEVLEERVKRLEKRVDECGQEKRDKVEAKREAFKKWDEERTGEVDGGEKMVLDGFVVPGVTGRIMRKKVPVL